MTAEAFLEEVKSSGLDLKNFEQIYGDFREYQKLAMETLKEIHRICEKENISYQLAYGSLLGAIRDNGQIPWDYDIDIFVPFEERERLVDALKTEMDSRFYFYCPEVDPKCRHEFIRVTPEGYRSEILHVDVFFLTGAPDDEKERTEFCRQLERVSNTRFYKRVKPFDAGKGHPRLIWQYLKGKIRYWRYSLKEADETYRKLCTQYSTHESKTCVSADVFAGWYAFPSELLWNTKLISTESGTFRIPAEYAKILRIEYGDYMSIPPIESRINEMMEHYNQLKKYSRK